MRPVGTTLHLDGSVDEVLLAFADPDYHRYRAAQGGALQSSTSATIREGYVRVQRTEGYSPSLLPPMAARMVGEELQLVVDQQLPVVANTEGVHEGRWRVTVLRMAIRAEGTLSLVAVGTGSTLRVAGQVEASNPLLGPAMETAAVRVAERTFAEEGVALTGWLGGSR